MLVYVDIVSGKEVCTDSYPSQTKVDGAVMVVESKRVTRQDAEVDIGANASAEGADEDEKVESSGPKTVINIVDAHQLTKTELSAKEFKATLKTFWKALVTKLGSRKNAILFDDAEYKAPEDKAAAKAAEAEAREELDATKKAELDAEDKRLATFKKNFEASRSSSRTKSRPTLPSLNSITPRALIWATA